MARYLRVSRLGDRTLHSDEFHSPELQIEAIDRELDRVFGCNAWRLVETEGNYGVGTWADLGVSGTSTQRDGLDAAITAAAANDLAAIGVLNVSRWARNTLAALARIDELEEHGSTLISANEKVDLTTSTGRFQTSIFLAMAELFSDQKAEEWSALIERRAVRGQHHGQVSLGYYQPADPATGHSHGDLLVDDAVAADILEAFEMGAAGASTNSVGRFLVGQGRLTLLTNARKVLVNRNYRQTHGVECAEVGCTRTDVPHGTRGEVRSWELEKVGRLKKKRTPNAQWYAGRHEGIVPAALFDAVQVRLASRTSDGGRRRTTVVHEVAGVLRCAYCHRTLSGDDNKGYARFTDGGRRLAGCRGVGSVSASKVLPVVLDALRAVAHGIDDAELVAAASKAKPVKRRRPGSDPASLLERRRRALGRIADLEAERAVGDYRGSDEEAEAVISRLRSEMDKVDEQLAAVAPVPEEADASWGPKAAADLLERWDVLDANGRNGALRDLVTVYVGRRDPNGPPRQDYATRCSIRFSWER